MKIVDRLEGTEFRSSMALMQKRDPSFADVLDIGNDVESEPPSDL